MATVKKGNMFAKRRGVLVEEASSKKALLFEVKSVRKGKAKVVNQASGEESSYSVATLMGGGFSRQAI
jgi:hypothetical protein